MIKIDVIAGARPNFIKVKPLLTVLKKNELFFKARFIHTGQHYDFLMNQIFFEDLEIPEPDHHLEVGSCRHATQTAKIMLKYDELLQEDKPDVVIVVGDVNSTLATTLVAAKENVRVAHVEAGLRSFDNFMPEEINRVLTDRISDYLFTPSEDADLNLKSEGVETKKIFRVGNIMIDTLSLFIDKATEMNTFRQFGLEKNEYALITIHRPSNVDRLEDLNFVVETLNKISVKLKLIFPVHPRTKQKLDTFNLLKKLQSSNITLIEPLGYLKMLNLMINSKFVLTDSGGVQEETTFLNIPCLTLRENTERPVTVTQGSNCMLKFDSDCIFTRVLEIMDGKWKQAQKIEMWDGKTAERIIDFLKKDNEKKLINLTD